MKILMKVIILITGMLLFGLFYCAFDWPVEQKLLLTTFGEDRDGSFYPGIDLAGEGNIVFPIADGEVIFYYEDNGGYSSVPRGNGNFVIIQHEGGIQSVYSHLDALCKEQKDIEGYPKRIEEKKLEQNLGLAQLTDADRQFVLDSYINGGDGYFNLNMDLTQTSREKLWQILYGLDAIKPVGIIGDSGATTGPYLSLMIFDIRDNKILNPIHLDEEKAPLKPSLSLPAGKWFKAPIIEEVTIKRGTSVSILKDGSTHQVGNVEIWVKTYDINEFVSYTKRIAPYSISLIINGSVEADISFTALEENGNRLELDERIFEDLYLDNWIYKLGTLTLSEGEVILEVRVQDSFGKTSSALFNLNIVP
jgi:hypothetical protein